MSDSVKAIEYKGYTIKIYRDEDSMNPRTDFDNMTKMACSHPRYNLGDKEISKEYDRKNYNSFNKMFQDICLKEKPALILPLYLYDHSGITISTTPFGCQWDSTTVGFVWITKEQAKQEFNIERIVKSALEKISKAIKRDVEIYDNYLTGEVYGYQISKDGEEVESCFGYYGNYDDKSYIMQEAKSAIDFLTMKKEEKVNEMISE